jgi:4-diphosphocytidyl-2C-methyl-D-erythritol kinase
MKEQKFAIEEGDEERLARVLDEKDETIETLRQLEKKQEKALAEFPENERAALIRQTETIKEQIETSLREIIRMENECARILEKHKDQLGDKMRELRQSKSMLKGYGSLFLQSSYFSRNA